MGQKNTFYIDEINLHIVLYDIWKNILYIFLIAAAAFLLVKSCIGIGYRPLYKSQAILAVTVKMTSNSAYSSLKTAANMATAFIEVFESDVMEETIREVSGNLSEDVTISAEQIPDTNLIRVSTISNDPRISYEVMSAIASNYTAISDHIFSNAVIELMQSPEIPLYPSNESKQLLNAERGMLIGLCLAVSCIVLLSVLRRTVKTKRQAERTIDGTCLAVITYEVKNRTMKARVRRSVKGLLLTNPLVSSRFEECNYKIANKIDYLMKTKNKKILLVSSVMENEGKTTIAANLALALAQKNKKVALIDCDLRKPAAFRIFEYSPGQFTSYIEYVKGNVSIKEVLIQDKKRNLYMVLNSRKCEDAENILHCENLRRLLQGCANIMDYVILDTAPLSYYADTEILADMADASILVIRQDYVRIDDINNAVDNLKSVKSDFLGFILNGFKGENSKQAYDYYSR